MASIRDELPIEGDEEEAQELVARNPIRLPTYRLERVHVAILNVDYAPPHGTGYARPLSAYRLGQLRRDWDPLAVSPLTLSRRPDNTLWTIDGNHRRYIAYEKGMLQLPAMVHSGLEREQEADLYTKLGTVLGQTPWTRFLAKLASGDAHAQELVKIVEQYGFSVNGSYGQQAGVIQAIARVEWIHVRGGVDGLNWTLSLLSDAFGGERESLGAMQLEGVFGFYLRYHDRVDRDWISGMMRGAGLDAWFDRADALNSHVDVGTRANTFGMAIAEMVNDVWRRQGKKPKDLLPAWERLTGVGTMHTASYPARISAPQWRSVSARGNLTPQQLT